MIHFLSDVTTELVAIFAEIVDIIDGCVCEYDINAANNSSKRDRAKMKSRNLSSKAATTNSIRSLQPHSPHFTPSRSVSYSS